MAACNSFSGGPQVGANNYFYLNLNSEILDAPLWIEIGEITDLAVDDFSLNVAELKRRANEFTKNVAALFNSVTISFRLVHGLGKTEYDLLQLYFETRAPKVVLICDGDAVATSTSTATTLPNPPGPLQVLQLPVLFTAFPWDQPLEDIGGHDITATVAYMCSSDASPTEIDPLYAEITNEIDITP